MWGLIPTPRVSSGRVLLRSVLLLYFWLHKHVCKFVKLEITQHVKFTKAGNLTKTFSSKTFIETNNIFAIRGKKPFLFQLRACKQDTQSVSQSTCNSINF